MANDTHRKHADAARHAAEVSVLPNVRDREMRSARAHEAMATREEQSAAKLKLRQTKTLERRASDDFDEENDDGGLID
jgi:hypothetical protein